MIGYRLNILLVASGGQTKGEHMMIIANDWDRREELSHDFARIMALVVLHPDGAMFPEESLASMI